MEHRIKRVAPWLLIGALLAVTALIYMPGLSGGFIYDDGSFITGNAAVHVTDADPRSWAAAAFSFPGGLHQGRWLGMLTFAANYYFGELDPFGFKLVNLIIHLVNGCLVFLLLRNLFALRRESADGTALRSFDGGLAAATLAGLWLVLPINLTAVLYVSQRLEALSSTFVFLGLAWYLHARLRFWRGEGGVFGLWASLLVCTGLGFLVKESAILLPLYAACVEFAITRARNRTGDRSRAIYSLYAVFLLGPLLAGLYWLSTWVFGSETYARSFDTWQRLLSEARVLIDYIQWSLVPSLDSLTLYHDDIQASKGLLDPPSTLAAVAGLALLGASAIWQRRRRPLFALGIAWFLCGHLLTGTIIPLLLAFEHRNYFSSLGLLLACASLIALEGTLERTRIRIALAAALVFFYAFTTWMRAEEWSNPLRLALSEAGKRPDSPAAQYEHARALIAAGSLDGRPLLDDAIIVLQDKRSLPGASILYEASLIVMNGHARTEADPAWWDSILDKLRKQPPSQSDAQALEYLSVCFIHHDCKEGLPVLAKAYDAAMAYPSPSAYLLSAHGEFAWHLQGDVQLAERQFRAAIALSPRDVQARQHLVDLLISTGKLAEARVELDALGKMNTFGMFNRLITELNDELHAKEASPAS